MRKARSKTLSMMALLSCTALVACDKEYVANRDPQFSDLVLDANTMPETGRIQVPMPANQVEPRKFGSQRASLWGHTNATLYSDQRAGGVGDILTINIAIDDQASLSNATNRTRGGSSTLGAPVIEPGGKVAAIRSKTEHSALKRPVTVETRWCTFA